MNVSSVAAQIGAISTAMHYAASKAAILAMTRSFARIRVRADPCERGCARPDRDGDDGAARARRAGPARDGDPAGSFGTPSQVAETIVLLASPDSGFTTGATYDVNGGVRID